MVHQEFLKFPEITDYTPESFVVSDSNAEAHRWITAWPNWPSHCAVLVGGKASGKTHLCNIWQRRTAAIRFTHSIEHLADLDRSRCYVVDGLDFYSQEENLFHLYNFTQQHGNFLLITLPRPPREMWLSLPDLQSRLNIALMMELKEPDDALVHALWRKHFADRQLQVPEETVVYLANHLPRSFSAIKETVHTLDTEALKHGKPLNLAFVKNMVG